MVLTPSAPGINALPWIFEPTDSIQLEMYSSIKTVHVVSFSITTALLIDTSLISLESVPQILSNLG